MTNRPQHSARAGARWRRPRHALRVVAVALPTGLVIMTTGCLYDEEDGSGDMAIVLYEDLDDIEISGLAVLDDMDVDVIVDPSLTQSAAVRIDDNLVDRGYASLDDGVLAIGFDGLGDIDPSQTPRVTLTVERLDTIENHSAGDLTVTGIDGGSIEVVNGDDGTVTASGTADTVELRATSSGRVELAQLVAGTVELDDTADGPIEVNATDLIEGEISGDADVVVYGDPAATDVDLDGDGALVTA